MIRARRFARAARCSTIAVAHHVIVGIGGAVAVAVVVMLAALRDGSVDLERGSRRGRFVVAEGQQTLGQVDHAAEPVEHDGLEFGARGTGGPREADDAETSREHLADYRRVAVARRKVGVKSRMLPVGHAGQDFGLEVAENVLPLFALLRCLFRQQFAQIARLHVRCHARFAFCLRF